MRKEETSIEQKRVERLKTLNHSPLQPDELAFVETLLSEMNSEGANELLATWIDGLHLLSWMQYPPVSKVIVGPPHCLAKIFQEVGVVALTRDLALALSTEEKTLLEQNMAYHLFHRLDWWLTMHEQLQQRKSANSDAIYLYLQQWIQALVAEPSLVMRVLEAFPSRFTMMMAIVATLEKQGEVMLHRLLVASNTEHVKALKQACLQAEASFDLACRTVTKIRGNRYKAQYAQFFHDILSDAQRAEPRITKLTVPVIIKLLRLDDLGLKALLLQHPSVIDRLQSAHYAFTVAEERFIQGEAPSLLEAQQRQPLQPLHNRPLPSESTDRPKQASVTPARDEHAIASTETISDSDNTPSSEPKMLPFLQGIVKGVQLRKTPEVFNRVPGFNVNYTLLEKARQQAGAGDLASYVDFENFDHEWESATEVGYDADSMSESGEVRYVLQPPSRSTPLSRARAQSDPGSPPPPVPERDDEDMVITPLKRRPELPPRSPARQNDRTNTFISPRSLRFQSRKSPVRPKTELELKLERRQKIIEALAQEQARQDQDNDLAQGGIPVNLDHN